ncbi:MAG: class II aldolase/adducin family protein [Bacteroidia bacterium]
MQTDPEEGVIKFRCEHIITDALPDSVLTELKHFRQLLYMQKLIGTDDTGIGYGNISQRFGNSNQFIISGTQTGHLQELQSSHFTLVEDYNITENRLKCAGPIKASSESLTHAALYSANPQINAVIHIHQHKAWNTYLYKLPTTAENIPYGSPEMALAIMDICIKNKLQNGVVIMGGHKDGLIAFGENLEVAYQQLTNILVA